LETTAKVEAEKKALEMDKKLDEIFVTMLRKEKEVMEL
jgi:hypothetical protein